MRSSKYTYNTQLRAHPRLHSLTHLFWICSFPRFHPDACIAVARVVGYCRLDCNFCISVRSERATESPSGRRSSSTCRRSCRRNKNLRHRANLRAALTGTPAPPTSPASPTGSPAFVVSPSPPAAPPAPFFVLLALLLHV